MPQPDTAPSSRPGAGAPPGSAGWRRAIDSPTALWVATTAVSGGLLAYYFRHLIRGDLYYKFIEFLFDYRFGITRRGLEGEVYRHLQPPPYAMAQFQGIANLLLLTAILLFVLIGAVALRRHPRRGVACLLIVIAASPLTFKNQIFDQGRQDVLGLIFFEAVVLAVLACRPRTALVIATAGILPLSLVHDGQLLLYVPAALVALAMQGRAACPWRARAVPLAVFGASLLLNWTLPPPRVPYPVYHAYLQSKSLEPYAFTHDLFLYARVRGGLAFAASELHRWWRFQIAEVWDYLAAFATLAAVGLALCADREAPRRSFLVAVAPIVPGYAVLVWLASDWARWTANFGVCLLLLALVAAVQHRLRPNLAVLLVVAALELACNAPFGIEVPELCLGYRAASLLGIAPGPAAAAYARSIAHERGVHCLSTDRDYARAADYFRQALAIAPGALDHAYLGLALVRGGQTAPGIAELEAAVRLEPGLAMAHFYLGAALLDRPGRRADGLAQLRDAERRDPTCASAVRQLLDQDAARGPRREPPPDYPGAR